MREVLLRRCTEAEKERDALMVRLRKKDGDEEEGDDMARNISKGEVKYAISVI